MEIQLLGSVSVRNGSGVHEIRARNVGICISLLALQAGRPVRSSTLTSELWGDDEPRDVGNALQATIARTRSFLGRSGGSRRSLRTVPDGYVLDVPTDGVDALAFRSEAEQILQSAWTDVDRCTRALEMWAGPALLGVSDGTRCLGEATSLEELRLRVLERRATRRLADGDHVNAARDIAALTIDRPLNEYYCELHMIALYHLGQHAGALQEFNRFADAVDREMGMVPSSRTRDVYTEILTDAHDLIEQRVRDQEPCPPARVERAG